MVVSLILNVGLQKNGRSLALSAFFLGGFCLFAQISASAKMLFDICQNETLSHPP